MIEQKITINDAAARAAFAKAPEVVTRHVDALLGRGAQEVAREEKLILVENKSMARSILANSIRALHPGPMHWQVRAGTDYARMVEEGTGPAAGRKAYMPNPVHLRDYIKQRSRITFKSAKAGSPKRRSLMQEVRDRAWGLALWIRKHGTKPHPFAKPALERKRSRLFELVNAGAAAGVAEVFGGKP